MNLILPIFSALLLLLLQFVFYSKKRILNSETNIYKWLMIFSNFNIVFNIIGIYIGYHSGNMTILRILNHLDLPLYFWWASLLFLYLLFVDIDNEQKYNKFKKLVLYLDVFFTALTLFLPFEVVISSTEGYAVGLCVNFVYLICGCYIILSLFEAIKISNKGMAKKAVPVFVLLLLGIIAVVIQKNIPNLIIIPAMIVFIELIMYFTIENPDVKMLEEIKKANDLSEKYNNDKSKFIFNMTQQVRYPLNSIEQKLEQAKETEDIEEIKEILEEIQSDEKRISNIINGTLNVSTIDSKKIKIVESEYNLSNLLKEIKIRTEKMAAEKNLEFRTNIDESIPMFLYGDSIRMKQLINSILSNSIKYTNEGFVELDVSTIKTYDICRLIISVKDSGIGLKTEEIDKLFNNNDNEEIGSIDETDMKLEVVKKLVNMIGGTITVQSEKNKGSEFTIVVDQKIVNDSSKYVEMIENYEKETEKKKILFVSEREQQQEFYRKRLSSSYNIEIAKNGQDCLERIRKGEVYNAIIISEELEKLSAIDILNKLKDIENFNTKTYILCKEEEKKDYYKDKGFEDLLKTDMSLKALTEKLEEEIE